MTSQFETETTELHTQFEVNISQTNVNTVLGSVNFIYSPKRAPIVLFSLPMFHIPCGIYPAKFRINRFSFKDFFQKWISFSDNK